MVFNHLNVEMFNTVQYHPALKDDSWIGKLEAAADVCRGPSRWVAAEFFGWGKTYIVGYMLPPKAGEDEKVENVLNFGVQEEEDLPVVTGMQKAMRIALGIILSVPGQILAVPLTAIIYCCSEEIRLKHTIAVRKLSDEEQQKLAELIMKRQELAKERQGCEPISCALWTICSLLCYLVCCKDD